MVTIEFSKEQKAAIAGRIKAYFLDNLDQEIGQFDAEFLLDFFSEEVGPYYYNSGLRDARSLLEAQLENISDALYEIEKPTQSGY